MYGVFSVFLLMSPNRLPHLEMILHLVESFSPLMKRRLLNSTFLVFSIIQASSPNFR